MIELHIEKNGTQPFANSNIVVTEQKHRLKSATVKSKLNRKIKQRNCPRVLFDINESNIVLMKKQRHRKVTLLGQEMLIENASDEEDPQFIERLIRDPPKTRNKESDILKYYKEPKLTATATRMAESLRIRHLT